MSRDTAKQQQPRQGDMTGVLKAQLEKDHAEALAAREAEIALATAAAHAADDEPEDLAPVESAPPKVVEVEEVEVNDVEVADPEVVFRVNETLDKVTIGYGNTYDFVQGKKYTAPKSIYDYLDERGLVWH